MDNGIPQWLLCSLVLIILSLGGMLCAALVLLYRLTKTSMGYRSKSDGNMDVLLTELLYSKTLQETGSHVAAADILKHSDAHDHRINRRPEIYVPDEPPEPEQGIGEGNVSPIIETLSDELP